MRYSRRTFLAQVGLLALGLALPTPPNIILILADDLGYGDLGCYGQRLIRTPNIDALASQGLRFSQAYAPAPACAPTRWSLMTGKHIGEAPAAGFWETHLSPEEATVAEALRARGYETACFGKWGIGHPGTGNSPAQKGFDHFLGYMNHFEALDYYAPYLWENDDLYLVYGNHGGRKGVYIPELLTDKAVESVRNAQAPFFLYYAPSLIHVNSQTQEFQVPDDVPYTAKAWPQIEKNYASMVTRLDDHVGQLLAAIPDNTIVIFTSDNGPYHGSGHDINFFGSAGESRGSKGTMYEGGLRVPLIVSTIGVSTPGIAPGVERRPAWLVNFFQAALSGDFRNFVEEGSLYFAYSPGENIGEAVRAGDWKGIRQREAWELYDLTSDPGETTDLAAGNPDVIGLMEAVADRYCPSPKTCRLHLPVVWK